MQIQTKALYNLVKFTAFHNPKFKVKKWQVEDLRILQENFLFKKLNKLGLSLDKEIFFKYANEVSSPEELAEVLVPEKPCEEKDQIYLVLFELFRRFFSEKRCLSLFCDELDHRIFLYDTNQLKNDELLQDALANLKTILDSNVDLGSSYTKTFQNLLKYLAHDLEKFFIDYISDQIDVKNETYAIELIDSFYPYINKKIWFNFFKAKIKALKDVHQANNIIEKILDKLKLKPDLDLYFKILEFMVDIGYRDIFLKIVKQLTENIKQEKDFKRILKLVADYYIRLDKDDLEKKISNIITKRSDFKNNQTIKKQEIKEFLSILS